FCWTDPSATVGIVGKWGRAHAAGQLLRDFHSAPVVLRETAGAPRPAISPCACRYGRSAGAERWAVRRAGGHVGGALHLPTDQLSRGGRESGRQVSSGPTGGRAAVDRGRADEGRGRLLHESYRWTPAIRDQYPLGS